MPGPGSTVRVPQASQEGAPLRRQGQPCCWGTRDHEAAETGAALDRAPGVSGGRAHHTGLLTGLGPSQYPVPISVRYEGPTGQSQNPGKRLGQGLFLCMPGTAPRYTHVMGHGWADRSPKGPPAPIANSTLISSGGLRVVWGTRLSGSLETQEGRVGRRLPRGLAWASQHQRAQVPSALPPPSPRAWVWRWPVPTPPSQGPEAPEKQ